MTDVLIRNIPDDVLAAVDANAARLGVSRAEYIRRRLAAERALTGEGGSAQDLLVFGERFSGLADESLMDAAWR